MKASFKRKLDKHERQTTFIADNAADFPAASKGGQKTAALILKIVGFKQLAAQQVSGADDSRMHFDNKGDAIDELFKLLKKMSRTANAMDDEIPNLESKFRLPRNRSQQSLINSARSYYADAEGFEAEFIEYELSSTFRADLLALIERIEATKTAINSAGSSRGEATGGLAASMREQSRLSDQLDDIVRIKYADNQTKLKAWEIASHLEREPQHTPPPSV